LENEKAIYASPEKGPELLLKCSTLKNAIRCIWNLSDFNAKWHL